MNTYHAALWSSPSSSECRYTGNEMCYSMQKNILVASASSVIKQCLMTRRETVDLLWLLDPHVLMLLSKATSRLWAAHIFFILLLC